jgi:hypothetical protein
VTLAGGAGPAEGRTARPAGGRATLNRGSGGGARVPGSDPKEAAMKVSDLRPDELFTAQADESLPS